MAFIRKKKRGDATYLYQVENYRENGKVRQRVLAYLGKLPTQPSQEGITTPFKPGDWVKLIDCQGGEMCGTVIPGETQVEACPYPKRGRGTREIVTIPYQVPGTVTVRYEWLNQMVVVTLPVSRVRRVDDLPLAGHGRDVTRVQLELG